MERTYNDILAENKRLQDSLDVMIDKNAELVFREKALKTENDFLKKENAFIMGSLTFYAQCMVCQRMKKKKQTRQKPRFAKLSV